MTEVLKTPAWAAFLRPLDFVRFAALVQAELERRGLEAAFESPEVSLEVEGRETTLSLARLAQRCRSRPAAEWEELVRDFFKRLDVHRAALPGAMAALDSFAASREKLKLRVRAEAFLQVARELKLVARPIAPGLCEQLVLDFGTHRVALPEPVLREWGTPPEQVWAAALANVRQRVRVTRHPSLGPHWPLDGLAGGPYTSAHVRCLERILSPDDHPFGALVAVPSTEIVFFHRLGRASDLTVALNLLHRAADDFFRSSEEGVSTSLYWWKNGRLELAPTALVDGTLQLRAGQGLGAALERLTGAV